MADSVLAALHPSRGSRAPKKRGLAAVSAALQSGRPARPSSRIGAGRGSSTPTRSEAAWLEAELLAIDPDQEVLSRFWGDRPRGTR